MTPVNETYKNAISKEETHFRKSKYVPIVVLLQSFYFTQKLVLSSAGVFYENSLIAVCFTFGRFEIQTLKPNRFQN